MTNERIQELEVANTELRRDIAILQSQLNDLREQHNIMTPLIQKLVKVVLNGKLKETASKHK